MYMLTGIITSNNVFFNLWSACLLTEGNATLPDYGDWVAECENYSLKVLDGYPSQWEDGLRVTIPSWAGIKVADNATFDVDTAIRVARLSKRGEITQAIVPIASVLGFLVIMVALLWLYWAKRSRRGETFGAFISRHFLRKAQKIRHMSRNSDFEIDSQPEDTDGDYAGGHSRGTSVDTLKLAEPEYQFPFKDVWRNSRIMQQFRRLPDRMVPWGDHPVQIRPLSPGARFRVDASGSSAESGGVNVPDGTAEGDYRESFLEEDEYPGDEYRNSLYGNEETALISPIERAENGVFLISNRPSFTISSNSSHKVKVVPPTPTESFLSHGDNIIPPPPTKPQPRRPPVVPPPPQQPPPQPPGSSVPRFPPLHRPVGPSRMPPPRDINQNTSHNPPLVPPRILIPGQIEHVPPPSIAPQAQKTLPEVSSNLPSSPHARRKGTLEGAPRRPMGARLPSHHNPRQHSFDHEFHHLAPAIESGESLAILSPPPLMSPQHAQNLNHQRMHSGDDRPPLRPVHGRTTSSESIGPDDSRMLYPDSVRAAGFNLPPETAGTGHRPMPRERAT
ncbi:hypothetical protein DXG01_016086 [Tephrocybe rancida]|nr:hypothetical protein DXG01_016086 [Tephrocybe rancida]